MFSEQFFDLSLNCGDGWKINFLFGEVDGYVSFIGGKAECPGSLEICPVYDHTGTRRWRHLDTIQFIKRTFFVTKCQDTECT